MHNSIFHLEKLLKNLSEKIKTLSVPELTEKFASSKMDILKNERMVTGM